MCKHVLLIRDVATVSGYFFFISLSIAFLELILCFGRSILCGNPVLCCSICEIQMLDRDTIAESIYLFCKAGAVEINQIK